MGKNKEPQLHPKQLPPGHDLKVEFDVKAQKAILTLDGKPLYATGYSIEQDAGKLPILKCALILHTINKEDQLVKPVSILPAAQ